MLSPKPSTTSLNIKQVLPSSDLFSAHTRGIRNSSREKQIQKHSGFEVPVSSVARLADIISMLRCMCFEMASCKWIGSSISRHIRKSRAWHAAIACQTKKWRRGMPPLPAKPKSGDVACRHCPPNQKVETWHAAIARQTQKWRRGTPPLLRHPKVSAWHAAILTKQTWPASHHSEKSKKI